MYRDDITYGIRDYELSEHAVGFFFMELVAAAFAIGYWSAPYRGGIFFLICYIILLFMPTLRTIMMFLFWLSGSGILYYVLEKYFHIDHAWVYALIGMLFSAVIHINAWYYYQDDYEYDDI